MTYFITIAGRRWPVEVTFKTGNDALGWDQCQARTWDAICRHAALTALAQLRTAAIQAALARPVPAAPAAGEDTPPEPDQTTVNPADLHIYTGRCAAARPRRAALPGLPPIELSAAETARIERLARDWKAGLISQARLAFQLRWSTWRRRHQARARWHHYATRMAALAT
jgi:hypothetical protein